MTGALLMLQAKNPPLGRVRGSQGMTASQSLLNTFASNDFV